MKELTVTAEYSGKRLDLFLAGTLALSRGKAQTLLSAGGVRCLTLPEKKVAAASLVQAEERFSVDLSCLRERPSPLEPHPMELNILFEDDEILVLNKPAGIVVHPGAGTTAPTLAHGVLAYTQGKISHHGGETRPGIVHRLDKDTSGVLVIAKTDKAHQAIAQQLFEGIVFRQYLAFCWGIFPKESGELITQIGRHPVNRQKMTVLQAGGKRAHTQYRVVRAFSSSPVISEVVCTLQTGRTHQIRVHMSALQHPVVGDSIYGRKRQPSPSADERVRKILSFPRQALHARTLRFAHPITGEDMQFTAPIPVDLEELSTLLCSGRAI